MAGQAFAGEKLMPRARKPARPVTPRGRIVQISFSVHPRYTSGSPALVDEETAERVARQERRSYEQCLRGHLRTRIQPTGRSRWLGEDRHGAARACQWVGGGRPTHGRAALLAFQGRLSKMSGQECPVQTGSVEASPDSAFSNTLRRSLLSWHRAGNERLRRTEITVNQRRGDYGLSSYPRGRDFLQ